MWIGVTTHKNSLGHLCLVVVFFLVWSLVKRWKERDASISKSQTRADLFILFITLILLKGPSDSYSVTAIVSLTVGLVTFICLLWMKKNKMYMGVTTLTITMTICIVFGIVTFFVGGSTLEGVTSTVGRDDTLTGRTVTWAQLVPVAMQQPIFGLGFGEFWNSFTREKYMMSNAHNGYLDVLLELGFTGLLLFSIFLLSSCRQARRLLPDDFYWGALWICFLVMAVVYNISESSFNSLSSQMTATLVFLGVCLPINYRLPQHDLS
jgi:O-antigen ligase